MFRAGCELSQITDFLKNKLRNTDRLTKLTIIDPYFYNYSHSKFSIPKEIIVNTLKEFTLLKTLEVVTPTTYTVSKKEKLEKEIKEAVPSIENINVLHVDGFHDRFWIMNENKGFLVGTSLNGMGNKHFFIQDEFLSDKDIIELLSIYRDSN